MPANRISAVVASMPKLMGKSSAMAPVTPMPGSTPVSVPTTTPATQESSLSRVKH